MKKYGKHLILLTALIIFILLGLIFFIVKDSPRQNGTAEAETGYVVKAYDGKLSVFKNGDNAPLKTFDTYIDFLPEKDKQRLAAGISAKSDAELQRIIEDYVR